VNIVFILVFKPHTHKVYILRHCTTIVYTTKDYLPENVTFMFTLEYMVRLNIADKSQELLTLREHLGSARVFGFVHAGLHFSFLYCVCLRLVSCVLNVARVSGLSILDFPFGFL
jgi:hypothetical protein